MQVCECVKKIWFMIRREEYKGVMRKTSNKGRELEVAEKGKTKGMHAIYSIIIHSSLERVSADAWTCRLFIYILIGLGSAFAFGSLFLISMAPAYVLLSLYNFSEIPRNRSSVRWLYTFVYLFTTQTLTLSKLVIYYWSKSITKYSYPFLSGQGR